MKTNNEFPHQGWNLDNSYARLPESFFTQLTPSPVSSPELVIFNDSLASALGFQSKELQSKEGIEIFAGNKMPETAYPLAQAYAGHQFGHFTMLGDGRALLIGEQLTPAGERVDIQLKGSGRTPFSRGGDGRAALGPMLREYVISEAMHALGIPTTRSLAVVATGEVVYRETELPGAVLTRVAASHLRVGTFQYAARWGSKKDLQALADYAWDRHFSDLPAVQNRYLSLLQQVAARQAQLIAKWQLAGFIHGVMNTDNMTISGETIDYGPCAFMDTFDPKTVFSSIDVQGRYAYGNQPRIGEWNLARFAEALLPLLDDDEQAAVDQAQDVISNFASQFRQEWLNGMRAKLGITNEEKQDISLVEDLLGMMQQEKADYTNTFRALTLGEYPADTALFAGSAFKQWEERWQSRLGRQTCPEAESKQLMKRHNPAIIPRNHLVEEALAAAVDHGDYDVLHRLLAALADPYAYSPEQTAYAVLPPPPSQPYQTYCGT
ncbi:YdiU family protein [Alkalihalobacillus oceani]|uniref:Protein nucleotidyltransferase YdiU n=1 Tax=Halalkalibacter oceani TaxID=1653776 RepID=A0A9X2ILZ8_9BACI|nr:YdiU family protein [Halalkalibacter oceani]MCM3712550.1 YdiU family protein [Halalkalibacter oceani]